MRANCGIIEPNSIIASDLAGIVAAPLPWETLHGKTIMVTGAAGFLAAYLVKALLNADSVHALKLKVICVVRSAGSMQARLADYINSDALEVFVHDIALPLPADFPRADIIIHSASQASPRFYGIDPIGTLMANSAGTMYLLEHAHRCSSEKFLFFSSAEVYGTPRDNNRSLMESDLGFLDPMEVRSCYAESKRMGETMCVAWAAQRRLHSTVVRPFHTYGPGMALDDGRVFADFVADVIARRDIVLKSDGSAQRSFCYVADATIGFLTVLMRGENAQAYNIANPGAESSMIELARTVAGLFPEREVGVRIEIAVSSVSYLRSPVARSLPSIEKAKSLGWCPVLGLAEGFRRTLESFM